VGEHFRPQILKTINTVARDTTDDHLQTIHTQGPTQSTASMRTQALCPGTGNDEAPKNRSRNHWRRRVTARGENLHMGCRRKAKTRDRMDRGRRRTFERRQELQGGAVEKRTHGAAWRTQSGKTVIRLKSHHLAWNPSTLTNSTGPAARNLGTGRRCDFGRRKTGTQTRPTVRFGKNQERRRRGFGRSTTRNGGAAERKCTEENSGGALRNELTGKPKP
jgi:hypothetical protein